VVVPETAASPLSFSTDALNEVLDWIEQQSETGLDNDIIEEEAVEDTQVVQVTEPLLETAVATDHDDTDDEADLAAMSEDPEAWLEQLLSDDLDMAVEMEPPPIKPSDDALFVTEDVHPGITKAPVAADIDETEDVDSLLDDGTLDGLPDDPDAAVAWLDQLVGEDELSTVGELDLVEESTEEVSLFDQDDDPEAWLEQMLSDDFDMAVEMEPPPIKPSEDAMFVTDDARSTETVPEVTVEQDDEAEDTATAVSETVVEPEVDVERDFGNMEDDPEAWLEQMLSDGFDMDIDMEPPPIKPSEDAMFVTDDGRSAEVPAADEPSAAADNSEIIDEVADNLDSETDIIADVPDDPDEAMIWLEQLAARQGAAIEELPSVKDAAAEPEMPDWMAQDLAELAAEPGLKPEVEAEVATEPTKYIEDSFEDEVNDADIDDELPDWLGGETDKRILGQTGWLQALPEVDVDTWLSAEEEASVTGSTEEIILPDTGPLTPLPQTSPSDEASDDDLFEPVMEPSTGAYNVDEAKLGFAQEALSNGRITEAIAQFKELVAAGTGMMTIIAELEQAAEVHTQTPALSQVLGDAYMRNGQLQKALAAYRFALDQM
jgi:hypothetical protein